jgi:REP element-mobilizing transposase RayT
MNEKYRNQYRIDTTRLSSWDYGWPGAYFITICTHKRRHFFGRIQHGQMFLSDIGAIVTDEWLKTPALRPDMNLELDEYVVMPNHFHAILVIGENPFNTGVEIQGKKGPQRNNLSSVIRGFKSAVTCRARKINPKFTWQTRFHDHIIRNGDAWSRIAHYIANNPAQWTKDRFHSPTTTP